MGVENDSFWSKIVKQFALVTHFENVWREDLLLFSYFAFAGKNMKSQCRNHLFFSLNFFKP